MRSLFNQITPLVLCVGLASIALAACSSDDSGSPSASGGRSSGGAAGSNDAGQGGDSPAQGGKTSKGGTTGSGGSTAKGGSSAQGGSSAEAGASPIGGDDGVGGHGAEPGSGGAGGIGGAPGAGGHGGEPGSGGAGGDAPTLEECLAQAAPRETRNEVLRFTASGLSVGLVRYADPDSFGTSGTTPWLADRFALTRDGQTVCISDPEQLEYVVSHHNFDDSLVISGETTTWTFTQQRVDYDAPARWTIQAQEGNTVAYGPVTLTLVSCMGIETDQDCSPSYAALPAE